MKSTKKALLRISLFIFSPIIALLILEMLSRLKYTPSSQTNDGPFEYHPLKVFALKPNYSGKFGDKDLQTNQHGYRDVTFPRQKPKNEIRILALGDSVTFGGWVLASETFTEQLESNLNEKFPENSYQVINAGTPGNGPMQEYFDLEEGLVFEPDAIILQFTLNDVTEPFVFLDRLGGSGWSYHGIKDVPAMDYYLGQHSSLYCLAKSWYAKKTYQGDDSETLLERGKKQEIYQKEKLITEHENANIRIAWKEYFNWLSKISDVCKEKQLPLLILICPFEFQLNLKKEKDYPQKEIINFCAKKKIPYINLLEILRNDFESQNLSYNDKRETERFWDQYFYDHDHFSISGHRFVAELLLPAMLHELGISE
jgi:lysophospholipase L1-like esterase